MPLNYLYVGIVVCRAFCAVSSCATGWMFTPVVLKLWGATALQVGREGKCRLLYFKTLIKKFTYYKEHRHETK